MENYWYIIGFAAFVSLVLGGRRTLETNTLVRQTFQKIEEGKAVGLTLSFVDFKMDEVLIVFHSKVAFSIPFTGSKRKRTAFARKNHYDRFGPALIKKLGCEYAYFHYTDRNGCFCTYVCETGALESRKSQVFKENAPTT